jgi:hypothetical protein
MHNPRRPAILVPAHTSGQLSSELAELSRSLFFSHRRRVSRENSLARSHSRSQIKPQGQHTGPHAPALPMPATVSELWHRSLELGM